MTETKSNGNALTAIRDLAELQKRLGNRMSPDDVLTVFEALDATEAELRKREKQIDAIGDGVVELARSWIEAIDEKVEESDSLRERAEKAERERDEAAKGLRILRACTVAERDRVYGYEMARLRAELARRTVERDSHCEHANQESSRASDYAEANETLRTRVAELESEVKRLRNPPAVELEEMLEIPDWVASSIERARGTSSRAPDARKGLYFDSVVVWLADDREKMLATTKRFISSERIMAARYHDECAEVKRLREAMPSEGERRAVARALTSPMTPDAFDVAHAWLTRLDAARGGAK